MKRNLNAFPEYVTPFRQHLHSDKLFAENFLASQDKLVCVYVYRAYKLLQMQEKLQIYLCASVKNALYFIFYERYIYVLLCCILHSIIFVPLLRGLGHFKLFLVFYWHQVATVHQMRYFVWDTFVNLIDCTFLSESDKKDIVKVTKNGAAIYLHDNNRLCFPHVEKL